MTKHLTSYVALHLLDHGVGSSTTLLHQSHQPYCQSACLAVPQLLFLLATCLKLTLNLFSVDIWHQRIKFALNSCFEFEIGSVTCKFQAYDSSWHAVVLLQIEN
jgi:hypothetical protein